MMNYAQDFSQLKWRTSIYSRILILQTNNKYDIQGKRKYIKRKKKQNNIKNSYAEGTRISIKFAPNRVVTFVLDNLITLLK